MRYLVIILVVCYLLAITIIQQGKDIDVATLHDINHNAGGVPTDFWDNEDDVGGGISVTAAAGLNSTANGLQFDTSVANTMEVNSAFSAPASNEIRFRVYLDPNGTVNLGEFDIAEVGIRDATSPTTAILVNVRLTNNELNNDIEIGVDYDDTGGFSVLSGGIVSDASHCVEVSIIKESSPGAEDGVVKLWVDSVLADQDLGVGSNTDWADFDEIFAQSDFGGGGSTDIYVDEIFVTDDAADVLGCSPAVAIQSATIADMRKPADVDADGTFLYIALLGTDTFPVLVKMSTALSADGTVVFDPGAGSNIGVQCGRFDTDVIWIAGDLGGTNTVEKSEDGGDTFAVKDDSTFGDIQTFVAGPDSDDRVLIYDGDNAAIEETEDSGTNWTEHDTAIDTVPLSMARLPINVQETVFGNATDAPNSNIEYSPNSGATREDYDAGFPESDVTSVIVNQ